MHEAFLEALRKVVPAERVLVEGAALAPYESDALTAFRSRPLAVALADSAEEVIELVRLCNAHTVPFVARGSGTSLSGGSQPVRDGLVIALNRLDRILEVDPDEMVAVVEPGVINLAVSEAAEPYGLYYAPDPSSQSVCTIGGNVAFNSGGAHCLKYGMTSNHVLAMKVVLADGSVVEVGERSLEAAGADVRGLFVGSEGLFGVALEITLRLLPRVESCLTLLAAYDSLESAGDAVARVVESGLLPGAMEIMDALAIRAAEEAVNAGYPAAAALLIVELEGEEPEVAAEAVILRALIERSGATEIRTATDPDERATIWKGRKGVFSSVGRLSPSYVVQDGVVPRSRLGEALAEVDRLGREHGLEVANVFHAGDGNLHPLILYDGAREGQFENAESLAGEILRMCIRLGGSITGEHGVGVEKKAYLPEMYSEADLDCMRRLRGAVDPRGLSNPGKMFLDGDAPALLHHGPHPLETAGVISRE